MQISAAIKVSSSGGSFVAGPMVIQNSPALSPFQASVPKYVPPASKPTSNFDAASFLAAPLSNTEKSPASKPAVAEIKLDLSAYKSKIEVKPADPLGKDNPFAAGGKFAKISGTFPATSGAPAEAPGVSGTGSSNTFGGGVLSTVGGGASNSNVFGGGVLPTSPSSSSSSTFGGGVLVGSSPAVSSTFGGGVLASASKASSTFGGGVLAPSATASPATFGGETFLRVARLLPSDS